MHQVGQLHFRFAQQCVGRTETVVQMEPQRSAIASFAHPEAEGFIVAGTIGVLEELHIGKHVFELLLIMISYSKIKVP